MDQNSKKIIKRGACLLFILFFLLTASKVAALPDLEHEATKSEHEVIKMEEMKIQGSVNKPNIMYIIPRARLPIRMKLNDDYFLPSPVDYSLDYEQDYKVQKKNTQSFPAGLPDVKEGSCVCCHYPEMTIPRHSRLLLRQLNQICLSCHPGRYYHICWTEVEKTIFTSNDQAKPDKHICQKCHVSWISQKEKVKINLGEYDIDTFCITCHRRKGY